MKTRQQRWESALLSAGRDALARGDTVIDLADITTLLNSWEKERDRNKKIALEFREYCRDLSGFQNNTPIETVFDVYWDSKTPFQSRNYYEQTQSTKPT